jgi:hypothetical protein
MVVSLEDERRAPEPDADEEERLPLRPRDEERVEVLRDVEPRRPLLVLRRVAIGNWGKK